MNQLKVIEKDGNRVLTTPQLAEVFGTETKVISYNFNYNKNRYEEGKHYIALTGEERKEFVNHLEIQDRSKHAHTLYLWTDKGAFLHAKSLNTDQAWDAYTGLVDDYFKKIEISKQPAAELTGLSPQLQFLVLMEQRTNELEQKQAELNQTIKHLSLVVDNEIWITDHQKAEIQDAVKKRVGHLKGQAIDAHFQGIYGDLNKFFSVPKYDKIKRGDFEQAMDFINGWYPKKKENTASL